MKKWVDKLVNSDTNELSSSLLIAALAIFSGGGGVGFLNFVDDFWRVD